MYVGITVYINIRDQVRASVIESESLFVPTIFYVYELDYLPIYLNRLEVYIKSLDTS